VTKPASSARIAVIGAGWAGLAAAVELTASGRAVTLFEAGRVAGGRARSIDLDGRTLDNGQHLLLGAYRDALALMRRVGADLDQLFDRRPLRVADNAGFCLNIPGGLPAPFNVAWGLMTAQGVSLGEKLRTALWMDGIKRRGFRLSADTTVADWLDAAGQTGVLRRHLWEPLCLAALNTPAERASAQRFANVLRDSLGSPRREDTDLLIARVPLGEVLAEPACRWLGEHGAELRFGTRVRQLQADANGVRIDGEAFAAAVLAIAPQHVGTLWPSADTGLTYEPIATVYLQFDPAIRLPFPLTALHGGVGQWVVDRGNGLLAAVQSGHGDWEKLDDTALARAIVKELGINATPRWRRVIKEKRATFCCKPRPAAIPLAGQDSSPPWQTTSPHLVLAGDYTWTDYPATLEGAVRSGLRAAKALLG
jgi:squalene-associated FAD-dependent desaturase